MPQILWHNWCWTTSLHTDLSIHMCFSTRYRKGVNREHSAVPMETPCPFSPCHQAFSILKPFCNSTGLKRTQEQVILNFFRAARSSARTLLNKETEHRKTKAAASKELGFREVNSIIQHTSPNFTAVFSDYKPAPSEPKELKLTWSNSYCKDQQNLKIWKCSQRMLQAALIAATLLGLLKSSPLMSS